MNQDFTELLKSLLREPDDTIIIDCVQILPQKFETIIIRGDYKKKTTVTHLFAPEGEQLGVLDLTRSVTAAYGKLEKME